MANLITIAAPIFIMIAVGYFSVRFDLFPREGVRFLGLFLINFALPAAIFKALASRDLGSILHVNFLFVYGGGSLAAFSLLFVFMKLIRGKDQTQAAILAMGGCFSNTLMLGIPILTYSLGEGGLVPLSLALVIENTLIMPMALALAEHGSQGKDKRFFAAFLSSLKGLLKSPIILGFLAGLLASLIGVPLSGPFAKIVDMFAQVVGGAALFTVGGMLVGLKLNGMMSDIYAIVATKLLVHPLMVLLMLWFVPLDPVLQSGALLLSVLPMFGIYGVIGQRYNLGGVCSASLLPAVLFSIVTISLAIWQLT